MITTETKPDYSSLDAHKLNFLVAEKVMGWVRGNRWGNGNGQWTLPDGTKGPVWDHTPRFSTDIACAFQVVEKMRERGCGFVINGGAKGKLYHVQFGAALQGDASNESIPRAICEAALTALETHG